MRAEATLPEGDDLPLILLSAIYHPDLALRASLRQRVAALVEDAEPRYAADEVRAVLQGQPGTVIEPFVLDEAGLDLATIVVRLGFSRTVRQTRIRVVSQETLGGEGGFVLTNNLRGYYVERFVLGRHRWSPKGGWFVAPGTAARVGSPGYADLRLRQARLVITDDGMVIRVPWPLEGDPAGLARRVQAQSRVLGSEHTLDRLGLRVDAGRRALEVRTGNPESVLRLTALCMRGAVLALVSSDEGDSVARAYVRLAPPVADAIDLSLLISTTSRFPSPWIRLSPLPPLPTTRAERLAIARWLPPHELWIEELIEELL